MVFESPPALDSLHKTAAYRAVSGAWDEPVALACSGGVDSTALLLLAVCARDKGRLPPFLTVYVDHRSRPNSKAEAHHVAALCEQLRTPFTSVQIQAEAPPAGTSIEAWWREQRYAALRRVVDANQLTAVATAHTLDDQVETILLRMLSGAGGGLSGMQYLTELDLPDGRLRILRPLLEVSRSQLEKIVEAAGVQPIEDPSNDDLRMLRNRVRHRLVPILQEEFPGFQGPLLRAAQLAQRDAEVVDRIADGLAEAAIRAADDKVMIDRDVLIKQPAAVATRLVMRALELSGVERSREAGFERIEAVRLAAAGRTGAVIELPDGLIALVQPKWIAISRTEGRQNG